MRATTRFIGPRKIEFYTSHHTNTPTKVPTNTRLECILPVITIAQNGFCQKNSEIILLPLENGHVNCTRMHSTNWNTLTQFVNNQTHFDDNLRELSFKIYKQNIWNRTSQFSKQSNRAAILRCRSKTNSVICMRGNGVGDTNGFCFLPENDWPRIWQNKLKAYWTQMLVHINMKTSAVVHFGRNQCESVSV